MEHQILDEMLAVQAPRILFFGMQSNFSTPSLVALLESGIDVAAVIVPATPLPGIQPPSIRRLEPPTRRPILPLAHTASSVLHIAWERSIPIWEVHSLRHAQTLSVLRSYEPDLLCVACFSLFVPPSILSLPRSGCLNVHPALLPVNRGPVPLFWTFREGHEYAGVTIHLMEEKMDSGAIVAQERFAVPEGIRYEQLEAECAQRGGLLLAHAVWKIFQGNAQLIPQDEAQSSYHTFPTDDDLLVIPQKWSACHLYNFIRGVAGWNGPVELYIANNPPVFAYDAVSYSREDSGRIQTIEGPMASGELLVSCKDGYVRVLLK